MKLLLLNLVSMPILAFSQIASVKLSPIIFFEGGVSKYYNKSPDQDGLKNAFLLDFTSPLVGVSAELAFRNSNFLQVNVHEANAACNFKNKLKNDVCSPIIKGGQSAINYTLFSLDFGRYSTIKSSRLFWLRFSSSYKYSLGVGFGHLQTMGINVNGSLNLGYSACFNGDNILLYDEYQKYISKNVFLISPKFGVSILNKRNKPVINIDLFARFGLIKNFGVDWKYSRQIGGVTKEYSVTAVSRGSCFGVQFSYPFTLYKKRQ
ncbi:MAG: hypothetical protein V4722_12335 [Bacteroidota bacterium]